MKAWIVPVFLVTVGGVVICSGAVLPMYDDPNWESRFVEKSSSSAEWYAAKAAAETPHNRRMDLGMGLVALGVAMGTLFAVRGVSSIRDLAAMASPKTRREFYWLAVAAWLSFIPAEWCWLHYTYRRGDYPYWSDSIAIPAFGVLILGVLSLPLILLGVRIALRGTTLPVSLGSMSVVGRPYVLSVGLCLLAALDVVFIGSEVRYEPFVVPSALLVLYLLLSGRAAAIVRERDARLRDSTDRNAA